MKAYSHPLSIINSTNFFTVDGEYYETQDVYERKAINNLLQAIVERAIRDALGITDIGRHTIREAREFVHSDCTEDWSFLWLADELRLSSAFIRSIRKILPRYSSRPVAHACNVSGETLLASLKAQAS